MKNFEALTKAHDSVNFLLGELREAHTGCTAVESILLLDMIGMAATLSDRIMNLRGAIEFERGTV